MSLNWRKPEQPHESTQEDSGTTFRPHTLLVLNKSSHYWITLLTFTSTYEVFDFKNCLSLCTFPRMSVLLVMQVIGWSNCCQKVEKCKGYTSFTCKYKIHIHANVSRLHVWEACFKKQHNVLYNCPWRLLTCPPLVFLQPRVTLNNPVASSVFSEPVKVHVPSVLRFLTQSPVTPAVPLFSGQHELYCTL